MFVAAAERCPDVSYRLAYQLGALSLLRSGNIFIVFCSLQVERCRQWRPVGFRVKRVFPIFNAS